MRYEGRLSDGTVFDRRGHNSPKRRAAPAGADAARAGPAVSSCDDGTTFAFEVGQGKVIRAWDVAVASMAVGERAQLLCRADYAYGDAGAPPDIPPDSTLVFVIDLLSVN